MNANQKGSQGNKQSDAQENRKDGAGTRTRGGTHEQHVEAGRQSHKNDANKQSGGNAGNSKQSGGNASEQLDHLLHRPGNKTER
ncbi:hypothetical protein [Janthinobacterium fluminis]|uniref:Stress-induced acidophilic repeat motif-containing protein n=1 Tax=Janthinobacterium fluminis TaxID=2987524 RepID=A0ABT5K4Q1_9BURK|nr:hypothetical protein [Janthinobacterium fluminis]MDC8759968.1 hypothetical protein [Janthinobacterium fluminis]